MTTPSRAVATIDLDRLASNLRVVRSRCSTDARVLAVVKADAYGHGASTVARRLAREDGVWGLGVASPAEGLELRAAGIDAPVLVLGSARPEEAAAVVDGDLRVALDTEELARALDLAARAAGRPARVHVMVDTGMGRLGVSPAGLPALLATVRDLPGLEVDGMMSHLSSAEFPGEEDLAYTRDQYERFGELVREVRASGVRIPLTHLANSAGTLYHGDGGHDLVRPGLALYGVHPSRARAGEIPLEPVMVVHVPVLQVRDVPSGAALSYGRRFVTRRPSRIAVLPMGYADGLPVASSNRASVTIRGRRAPVVGAVTMDMTLVDVTELPEVSPGDDAVVLGGGEGAPDAWELAEWSGQIPYEILCGIGPRVTRQARAEHATEHDPARPLRVHAG